QDDLPRRPAPHVAREHARVAVVDAVLAAREHALGVGDEERVVLLEDQVVDEVHTRAAGDRTSELAGSPAVAIRPRAAAPLGACLTRLNPSRYRKRRLP